MAWTLEEVSYRVLPRVTVGRALAGAEWRTLASAAEVLLAGSPVAIAPTQVADNVERFLIAGRSRRAFRVRVLLTLLEYASVPEFGARFSRMSLSDRRRIVEERMMPGHHVWGVCAKVRLLVLMGTYGDQRAHGALGVLPVMARPRIRHRGLTDAERDVAGQGARSLVAHEGHRGQSTGNGHSGRRSLGLASPV